MMYRTVNPYLKGMYHSIDSWRPNRKEDGWKMKAKAYIKFLATIQDDEVREKHTHSTSAQTHDTDVVEEIVQMLRSNC